MLRLLGGFCFTIGLWGCQTTGGNQRPPFFDAPAAATPFGVNVFAVLQRGGAWTNVGKGVLGEYVILPGGFPSGGMRFWFYAPYPAKVKVVLDGQELPKFEEVPAGQSPVTTGYYREISIRDTTSATPIWEVGVRPPNAKLAVTRYEVGISSVSINPNYPVGSTEHESAAMRVPLGPQPVSTVTVNKTGTGRGTVTSSPAGIQCGANCGADFGPAAFTVQLQATPAAGSTFSGWSSDQGSCSGTGLCVLNSTGVAITATASFALSGGGPGPSPSPCPGPPSVPGSTYVGDPSCASNDIAGHPSANLRCDAQGFFCCESVIGSNAPRCGGIDQREFTEDCMDFGPRARLVNHRGCFVED